MDFTISLAHFCEVHGPTPILCTQISPPEACQTCYHPCVTPPLDEPPSYDNLYSSPHVALASRLRSSPFETPPTSPTSPRSRNNPYFPSVTSETNFARRYSGTDDENEDCANCTFHVPKNISQRLPDGAPGSPSKDGSRKTTSPVLRTKQEFIAGGPASPQSDEYGSSPDSSDMEQSKYSTASHSSPSSPMYMSNNTHSHKLTYLTTHQPQSPNTFSLLRRSCIRALSCEMLPLGKSSGPTLFGDSVVGYTIAYIFRLPDPRARGQKRTYALIALGGRSYCRATKLFTKVTAVFETIANRIINLADQVLEHDSAQPSLFTQPSYSSRPSTAATLTPPLGASASSSAAAGKDKQLRNITPVSSFLSAKKVDPCGNPRASRDVMRAKSLSEIVGREDFFVELHAQFCALLSSLLYA